jgi:hypothetical protein
MLLRLTQQYIFLFSYLLAHFLQVKVYKYFYFISPEKILWANFKARNVCYKANRLLIIMKGEAKINIFILFNFSLVSFLQLQRYISY